MEKEYERIVMDAANVIRDDTGIEIKNDDGESLAQVRPERLRDAIEYCERKGWETIAFLQQGTYKMALKLKNQRPRCSTFPTISQTADCLNLKITLRLRNSSHKSKPLRNFVYGRVNRIGIRSKLTFG